MPLIDSPFTASPEDIAAGFNTDMTALQRMELQQEVNKLIADQNFWHGMNMKLIQQLDQVASKW
jgi:hypothetical protein